MTETVIHFQTGSSTVRCGAPMRGVFMGPADGWDLGTVTVDITQVTCSDCLTLATGRSASSAVAAGVAAAVVRGDLVPDPDGTLVSRKRCCALHSSRSWDQGPCDT